MGYLIRRYAKKYLGKKFNNWKLLLEKMYGNQVTFYSILQDLNLWSIVFSQMIQTKVKVIIFNRNKFCEILTSITKISFFQLKRLQLDQNNIQSIESLCFLQISQLQYLSIAKNRIVSIKNYFLKSRFPCLNKFHFQKNHIKNLLKIERLSILHKNQNRNKFQMCGQAIVQKPIQNDLSILAKIEIKRSTTISYLRKFIRLIKYFKAFKELNNKKYQEKYHIDSLFFIFVKSLIFIRTFNSNNIGLIKNQFKSMMQKIRFFLVIALVLIFIPQTKTLKTQHDFPKCKETTYSYSTFALSWVGQFCSQIQCKANWKDIWNGKSFTIHGYWPSSTDLSYLSCQQNDGYDRFCYQNYPFDVKKLAKLEKDLNRVWPQIGRINNFWQYEFDKHGTCYMKLTQDKFKKMSKDDIFFKYFQGSIQKYDKLNVSNISKYEFANKQQLAKQIKLNVDQFLAICGKDDQLDEIRICYNLAEPQKQVVINCPGGKPKQCAGKIILKQQQ